MRIKEVWLVILIVSILSGCEKRTDIPENDNTNGKDPYATILNAPGPPVTVRDGDFTIVGLPDTQCYIASLGGGTPPIFDSQIEWIKENQNKENIAYVAHFGDLTQHGDNPSYAAQEWYTAAIILYKLENPKSIPYGIAVGNHDQYPSEYPITGSTKYYNRHFGVEHFQGRPYYGGHYGTNNDSHYDLFSAGGMDFIVIYIEYDKFDEDQYNVNNWAHQILNQYGNRKAIVVSHYLIGNNSISGSNSGTPGTFRSQGKAIYNRVKDCPNVFMMLCGHVGDNGEGYREDTFQGNTIRTFLSDYQSRELGGNGLLRLYKISVEKNEMEIKTYSTWTNEYEEDDDSHFITKLFD